MSEALKRLELRLPVNHPIFEIATRQRVKVAKEWLDNGSRISGLEVKMADMERQLSDIKDILIKGTSAWAQKTEPVAAVNEIDIDIKAFSDTICSL